MKSKHINSIKNWLEPQSIREIQVFIGFANFYRRFIRNFNAIIGPLILMLKTSPCFKSFKPVKKNIKTLFQLGSTLFLTPETQKFFQNLKKTFYKETVLQYFHVFKLIKLKTNASRKIIEVVLCQQDKKMNWHFVAYYLCKLVLAERNYETHNVVLLAIVMGFKTWCYYVEKATYTILVFTDYKNLKKFIKTTCFNGC